MIALTRTRADENDHLRSMEDEELAERAKRNRAAFSVLYERYAPDMTAFVAARVRNNPELVADLTSQIFTKAFASIGKYRSNSFRSWLYAIARNLIIDEFRKQRPADLLHEEIPDVNPSLDAQLIARDAREQLHTALAVLTEMQRSVILLRLQGLTAKQIGTQLNMTDEAVKSAQYRAFRTLRDELGEDLLP